MNETQLACWEATGHTELTVIQRTSKELFRATWTPEEQCAYWSLEHD